MSDSYAIGENSNNIAAVCFSGEKNRNLLSSHLEMCSLMEEIFSHLLTITSYLSGRFIRFIEELVYGDIIVFSGDLLDMSSSSRHSLSSSCSCCTNVSHGCNASTSTGLIEDIASDLNQSLPVHSSSAVVEKNSSVRGIPIIFQGLMLPLYGLRLTWRLALASLKVPFCFIRCTRAKVCRVISRVQTTLKGSSDDIGWLQKTPGMSPPEDGSDRFLELLQQVRGYQGKIRDQTALPMHEKSRVTYKLGCGKSVLSHFRLFELDAGRVYKLVVLRLGFFSNHAPLYFVSTKKFFSKMGLACHIAKIHSEASVEHNAWELKHYIEELYWGSGKRVMLLGHSKGGVDAAAALSMYWGDLEDKVAGLAFLQSPYGGTPIASDILRDGQVADKETRRIFELIVCKLIKGDIRSLEDLTYEKRKEFIMKNKLPENIPLISFHSEANIGPGVLATMSHIAHAELPWLPIPSFGCNDHDDDQAQTGRIVPVVAPISAAMAVTALHLKLRYGEKSDGLVTCRDAEVPGSVVVRPDRKLDHAWMVYSSWKKDSGDPEACQMCEALLTMLVELGHAKGRGRG